MINIFVKTKKALQLLHNYFSQYTNTKLDFRLIDPNVVK